MSMQWNEMNKCVIPSGIQSVSTYPDWYIYETECSQIIHQTLLIGTYITENLKFSLVK